MVVLRLFMLLVRWGDAIEQEIRICTFLNKTRKKKEVGEVENGTAVKEQDK